MLNLDDGQYIRCVNCWLLHTNNKSILEHWNNGACLFYCSVCGKSFHDNIKELKPHFENEHGIKFRAMNVPPPDQITKPEPMENSEPVKKSEPVKEAVVEMKLNTSELKHLDEYHCEPCNRAFKHRQAYRTHYTLIHKKKQWSLNPSSGGTGGVSQKNIDHIVNSIPSNIEITKSSKNQKTIGKKWKKRTNEAVMKTVIRKPHKRPLTVTTIGVNSALKQVELMAEPIVTMPAELLVQCSTSGIVAADLNASDTQVSQDQTISSTYLPAAITNHMDDIQIKPEPELEPVDELANNYADMPVQSCNGWVHLPPAQYDEWNQNVVDPYDTSPRLKVKDLTDLQDPRQYPVESQPYQLNAAYKDQQMITPNQNMSGLQIQNVQSYQTHSVQPQPCVDYSCMNNMNSGMSMPNHSVCTSNLYDMHISQAQQLQNTQLINPVFLLPPNSEYHY